MASISLKQLRPFAIHATSIANSTLRTIPLPWLACAAQKSLKPQSLILE